MSRTSNDLIVSLVAGAAIVVVFASYELVENLRLRSEPGQGATFEVLIPIHDAGGGWARASPSRRP